MINWSALTLWLVSLLTSFELLAEDIIRTGQQQLAGDVRQEYNYQILETALKLTEPEFGAFRIVVESDGSIPKQRALEQLLRKNGLFNVALVPTQPDWEEKAIPIFVPIRLGLLSYRLLAIHADNQDLFRSVTTSEQLQALHAGLRKSWTTWEVMGHQGYSIVDAHSYNSLFAMLDSKRFDYIPRGIYEIYDEITQFNHQGLNIAVAPNIAIFLPTPYYAFVSPHEPRIARRLKIGLATMLELGLIHEMVIRHYGEAINKARISERKIIYIENYGLGKGNMRNSEYWLDLLSSNRTKD